MACGTGKTITSLRLLEKLVEDDWAPIAIVALPSLGLLGQTLTEWSRDALRVFSAAAVCSDDEVAHSPEAGEIVVPVTTNSEELGEWIMTTAGPRIIYTTYQSSPVVARALKECGEVADVLVADEAHRTASRDDATFATLLDDSRAPILRRVYLTATPRVHTSNAEDDLLLSMDDVEVYGDRAYTYSFSQAVEDDVLSDYQVAVVAMTNEEARSLSSGTSPAKMQSTAAQAALVRAALDYDVHRAFVYSASVARSEDFAAALPHVVDAMGGLSREQVTVDHLDCLLRYDVGRSCSPRFRLLMMTMCFSRTAGYWVRAWMRPHWMLWCSRTQRLQRLRSCKPWAARCGRTLAVKGQH